LLDRIGTGGGFSDHRHIRLNPDETADPFAHKWMVIDDENPNRRAAAARDAHSVAAARNVGLLQLRRYGVPIIFLTGYGDIAMTVRAVKAGAVDVLTKPVDDEALLNAVRQCLTSCDEGRVYLEAIRERRWNATADCDDGEWR
jgi:DNA-binding NarL/FixJ family response regulator